MVKTNIQRNKSVLWNKIVKIKRLQRLGSVKCVIIPTSWIETLNLTQEDYLVVSLDAFGEKIIIEKLKDREDIQIEKISGVESSID